MSVGHARAARVLVVEDNGALRRGIIRALAPRIATVDGCEDGAEAGNASATPGSNPTTWW